MAGDIVPLWGGELATGTTPVPCVVDMLRDLLARAERGEIFGLAVATVSGARTVGTEWAEAGGFKARSWQRQ